MVYKTKIFDPDFGTWKWVGYNTKFLPRGVHRVGGGLVVVEEQI